MCDTGTIFLKVSRRWFFPNSRAVLRHVLRLFWRSRNRTGEKSKIKSSFHCVMNIISAIELLFCFERNVKAIMFLIRCLADAYRTMRLPVVVISKYII